MKGFAQPPAPPALLPGAELAWAGFWALNGDRPLGMGAPGAIPFVAIDAYAARLDLIGAAFDIFAQLIRVLDAAFLKTCAARSSKPKS